MNNPKIKKVLKKRTFKEMQKYCNRLNIQRERDREAKQRLGEEKKEQENKKLHYLDGYTKRGNTIDGLGVEVELLEKQLDEVEKGGDGFVRKQYLVDS